MADYQTVTDVDLAIRGEIGVLNQAISDQDRQSALTRLTELKDKRLRMVQTRTYEKMLRALE